MILSVEEPQGMSRFLKARVCDHIINTAYYLDRDDVSRWQDNRQRGLKTALTVNEYKIIKELFFFGDKE